MTLRCECGGRLRCIDGTDPGRDGRQREEYECRQCGRNGTYAFGGGAAPRTGGCVTIVNDTAEVYGGP